jgi:hypothetical protein
MNIIILQSAYKHGITKESILSCLEHYRNDIMLELSPPKYLFAGFDHKGNALEIVAIENIEQNHLTIIHAMKLRKQYYSLLEENEYEL